MVSSPPWHRYIKAKAPGEARPPWLWLERLKVSTLLLTGSTEWLLIHVHWAILHPKVDSFCHVNEQACVHHTYTTKNKKNHWGSASQDKKRIKDHRVTGSKHFKQHWIVTNLKPCSPTKQLKEILIIFISSCQLFLHPTRPWGVLSIPKCASSAPPQGLCHAAPFACLIIFRYFMELLFFTLPIYQTSPLLERLSKTTLSSPHSVIFNHTHTHA